MTCATVPEEYALLSWSHYNLDGRFDEAIKSFQSEKTWCLCVAPLYMPCD